MEEHFFTGYERRREPWIVGTITVYRPICKCGWRGPETLDTRLAVEDMRRHKDRSAAPTLKNGG